MALSPILSIPLLTQSQSNKEQTINDAISFLEKAFNASTSLNLAAGNVSLNALDLQRVFLLKATGATANRTVTINENVNKIFAIDNSQNAFQLTVIRGSSTLVMATGTAGVFYVDGNRLVFLWYSANGGSIPFTFLSDVPNNYIGKAGNYLRVNLTENGIDFAPAGSQITEFTDLTDAPSTYTGHANALVRINSAMNALEFADKIPFSQINGTPANYTDAGGYYLRVKTTEDGIEFVAAGANDSFTSLSDTPDTYVGQEGKMVVVRPDALGVAFQPVPAAGVSTFTGLTDAPDSYSGSPGYYVAVKADGTGLEFKAIGDSIQNFTDLQDVPHEYLGQAGKVLIVTEDEDGLVFGDAPTSLPAGGTTGQVLTKASNTDGDAEWTDAATSLPAGGTAGQVLQKQSSTDGDAVWGAPPQARPYITGFFAGAFTSSEKLMAFIAPQSMVFTELNCKANAGTPAAAAAIFSIRRNGVEVGTIAFAVGANNGVVDYTTNLTLVTGDVMTIVAPASVDATIADVAISFLGN